MVVFGSASAINYFESELVVLFFSSLVYGMILEPIVGYKESATALARASH